MKVDILVGGFHGSESKGLCAEYLAKNGRYTHLVSVASAQAGHVAPHFIFIDGVGETSIEYFTMRHLPSGLVGDYEAQIIIGPGAVINPEVLFKEIAALEAADIPVLDRLHISEMATVIDDEVMEWTHSAEYERLRAKRDGQDPDNFDKSTIWGSTKEGVAQAIAMRAMRSAKIVRDYKLEWASKLKMDLKHFFRGSVREVICGVNKSCHPMFADFEILLEGSQGYGLSLSNEAYPRVTSRECTASAFLSYAGLPPRDIRHIYGVYRTFPIRVAGHSGPMYEEIDWPTVATEAGFDSMEAMGLENLKTTVTKRIRRVGRFDQHFFLRSILDNGIDRPILTFINHINREDEGKSRWDDLSQKSRDFVTAIEKGTGIRFWALSTAKWGGWIRRDLEV